MALHCPHCGHGLDWCRNRVRATGICPFCKGNVDIEEQIMEQTEAYLKKPEAYRILDEALADFAATIEHEYTPGEIEKEHEYLVPFLRGDFEDCDFDGCDNDRWLYDMIRSMPDHVLLEFATTYLLPKILVESGLVDDYEEMRFVEKATQMIVRGKKTFKISTTCPNCGARIALEGTIPQ